MGAPAGRAKENRASGAAPRATGSTFTLCRKEKGAMPETIPKGRAIEAEIFSAGTWNGETFTPEDLEEIARNFELLREVLSPPLKFGHDAEQTLLGQADGDPALGWAA